MPNYQNGKVYKIISLSNPDILPYYGSTTQRLCSRMVEHRNVYKKNPCKSKSLIECGDAKIVLIENYPCNSREELSKKEAEYILNNDCCNKQIPNRTPKEWREEHHDKIRENDKKYYEENRDKIRERTKQYYLQNRDKILERNSCVCGGKYSKLYKTKHLKTNKHISYINNL